jgi:dihydrofolate reductase/thymidylate synthase
VVHFDVVVAADREWGIGKANALPWPKLRGDLAHFKRVTSDASESRRNAVIMGRKTWDSAEVAGRPLPRRLNIVITRRGITPPEGVVVAGSLDAALAATATAESTFVVGGAEIFREAFAHAALRYVYLTRIDGAFGCDTHIPDLDALGFVRTEWPGACEGEDGGVRYRIERLRPPPGT